MDPDLSQVISPETPEPVEPPPLEPVIAPLEPVETPAPAQAPVPVESQNEAPEASTAIPTTVPVESTAPTISTLVQASPQPTPFDPHSPDELNFLRTTLLPSAVAARKARVAKHLDDIVARAREKGSIDHTGVCLLTKTAKSTATRYLSTLVRQGRLTRTVGRSHGGRGVVYHAV